MGPRRLSGAGAFTRDSKSAARRKGLLIFREQRNIHAGRVIARKVPAEYITKETTEAPESELRKAERWWYVDTKAPRVAGISPANLRADGHLREASGGIVTEIILGVG